MKRWILRSCLLGGVALAWGAGGCSSSNGTSIDSKPVVTDLTNNVILPTYLSLDNQAGALRNAAEALRVSPSADTLTTAQDAWRATRKAWRKSDAFRFGPANKNISAAIDFPASGGGIEDLLAGEAPITPEAVESWGTQLKGLLALEYLLFDNAGAGNPGVLTQLSNERRRLYVAAVAVNIKAKTAELYRGWDPAAGNYAGQLINPGTGNSPFPSQKTALDQLVNSATEAGDLVAGTKLAKPIGKRNANGGTQPELEETPRSDNSLADMLATLEGVQSMYDGKLDAASGKGIGDLVRARDAQLDDRMLAALNDARAKVTAIPPPFRTALKDHLGSADAAYESVRAMKNMFGVDVGGALGTAMNFNDNDGD